MTIVALAWVVGVLEVLALLAWERRGKAHTPGEAHRHDISGDT